jgi:inorganic pyrophosphatase
LAFNGKLETFALSKSLSLVRLTYAHRWGLVPSTEADDGDPLDIMVVPTRLLVAPKAINGCAKSFAKSDQWL